MKTGFFAFTAALLLMPAAVCAQEADDAPPSQILQRDTDQAEDDVFAAMADMMKVEPLSAEQQARLPLAQNIAARVVPDGALREMLDSMFNGFGPLMEMARTETGSEEFVAAQLGVEETDIALDAEQSAEIAAMFDPVRDQRTQIEMSLMPTLVGEMLTAMEPAMRKAMAEVYAVNFNQTELAEINAFFSTDTGAAYARKSYTMASDPRMLAATMEMLPDMMGQITALEERINAATADLPEQRSFAQLTKREKARIAKLTGFSVDDLEEWSAAQDYDAVVEEAAEESAEEDAD